MEKCPYNDSVQCNQETRDTEFVRQLNVVIRGGGFWVHKGKGGCSAQKALCCHLQRQHQYAMSDVQKILVGKIVAPQGIRGEVRVHTYTAVPDDFKTLKILDLPLKFVRTAGRDVAICRVDGVADRNAAETLRGTELFISRDALPAAGANEYYQADLIGFDVVRDGAKIGRVACFQNFGAGDIIELDNGDMVSFIGADVDIAARKIKVM